VSRERKTPKTQSHKATPKFGRIHVAEPNTKLNSSTEAFTELRHISNADIKVEARLYKNV